MKELKVEDLSFEDLAKAPTESETEAPERIRQSGVIPSINGTEIDQSFKAVMMNNKFQAQQTVQQDEVWDMVGPWTGEIWWRAQRSKSQKTIQLANAFASIG